MIFTLRHTRGRRPRVHSFKIPLSISQFALHDWPKTTFDSIMMTRTPDFRILPQKDSGEYVDMFNKIFVYLK